MVQNDERKFKNIASRACPFPPQGLYMRIHMRIHMTKVISLSDAAYEEMRALKQSGESFSDVARRLAERARKRPLADFFGKWPGTVEETERIKKTLAADRKRFRTREARF